ncbi:MAG: hypothetical protein WAU28_04470 [Candidatus Moraniibacteriota bacterium]
MPDYKCVHCIVNAATTRDHVFSASYYPDSTPLTVARPRRAPSCESCNNKLSVVEERFYTLLALCINPEKPGASGLQRRTMRKFGVGIAAGELNPEEALRRNEQKIQLLGRLKQYVPGMGHSPRLGPHAEHPEETQHYIDAPEAEKIMVAEKIIRGLEFHFKRRYVEEPYTIQIFETIEEADLTSIERFFNAQEPITYGSGYKVERVSTSSDPKSVLYRVTIWETFQFWAVILSRGELSHVTGEVQ